MSDWQRGDRAVFVGHIGGCPTCIGPADIGIPVGVHVVRGIVRLHRTVPTCGLLFDFYPDALCSCGFRKIRPDELTPCNAEFAALIKRPAEVEA